MNDWLVVMVFSPDQVLDRYRLKSQVSSWRFLAVFTLILLAWTVFGKPREISLPSQYVARIQINGVITDELERILTLQEIAENNNIKAVIAHINSPGGSFVGGENIFYALRKISEKKPIVTVMGETATSAAYMSAIGTDYIFARPGTLTGSIGILLKSYEITELAQRLGIKFQTLKTSIYKATPDPWEKLAPQAKLALEQTIESSYEIFFDMVQKRRNIPPETLKIIADGRVYNGKESLKNGLIDALGAEDEALKWLEDNQKVTKGLKIVNVHLLQPRNRLEQLLDSLSSISSITQSVSKQIMLE